MAKKGKKHTEETKQKMRKKALGRKHSEETKQKMSILHSGENNHMYGRKHSEETKQKMSISAKKRFITENNPMYGKSHSEETKQKMSETRIKLYDIIGRVNNEYCPIFKDKEWREIIYERDNNICQICGCSRQLNFKLVGHKKLTIHHIDHNKQNCHPNNCIIVCQRCNQVVENKKTKKVYEYLIQMKMEIENKCI